MSVYVDELVDVLPRDNWRYRRACHMFATSDTELHEMAERIGLKRSWHQSRPDFPHYDLTGWKRQRAIANGAIEVDRLFTVNYSQGRRDARRSRAGNRHERD